MKRKQISFDEMDFGELQPNFYNIDKEFFLSNKPLEKRLSSGYIDFNKIKNEVEFYEKSVRYITRTTYTLFTFITKEQTPSISLDIKDDQAWCSLTENRIHIGLRMLTYKKIPAQLRVDTIISTVFHEMYHKRETVKGIREDLKLKRNVEYYKNSDVEKYVKEFLKDDTMKSIFNIIEDKRIEAKGAYELPGYSFFFEEARKYAYYLHSGKKAVPDYEGLLLDYLMMEILLPELKEKFLKIFIRGLEILRSFKDQGEISEEEFLEKETTHKELLKLFKEIEKYIIDNKSQVFSFNYLDAKKTSEEIYKLIPENITKKINELIAKNDIKGYVKIIQTAGGKSFFTEEGEELPENVTDLILSTISDELEKIQKEAEEIKKNQERKVHIEKIKGTNKNSPYTEYEIIEEPVTHTDTIMFSEAKKISKNICNNLGFLDSRFVRNIENYELSEGTLDEDELYSIAIGNRYLFEDIEDIPAYSLDFGILLDESGSMSSRIKEAKLATLSMVLGLKDNKHINLFVYGHTANHGSNSSKTVQIYKYFNSLHRFTDYRRLFRAKSRSNNADGYAIEKVAEVMKESKSRDKIMIVVSDGQPSATGYGGASGENHVKEVVDRLESEGITVIQVCMAYIESSPKMFKHFVPYEADGMFFDNLKKILMTKLNQFADSI